MNVKGISFDQFREIIPHEFSEDEFIELCNKIDTNKLNRITY